jgi:hypothetical protein
VNPASVSAGKPVDVSVQVTDWGAGSQLAIVPAGPYASHQMPLSSPLLAMVSDGQHLFAAMPLDDGSSEMRVYTFPSQAAARLVSRLTLPQGRVSALSYRQGKVLAVVEGFGVVLVDVSRLQQPRMVARYQKNQAVRDAVLVSDEDLYLLLADGTLEQVDFQTGRAKRRAAWTLPVPTQTLSVRDGLALVTGAEGVAVMRLDPDRAQVVGRYTTNTTPQGLYLRDDLVLVQGAENGLVVLRLQENGQLQWLGSHNKRGAIDGLMVSGADTWVRLEGQTLLQMGLENPRLPNPGLAYRAPFPLQAMTPAHEAVFVADRRGLERIAFPPRGGAQLSPEGVNLGGSRRGVIRNNILYVADWFSGLHLYDISDPAHLKHLGNYHTPGSSKGVLLVGDYALVGDDDQGLQIMDVSDPVHPRWVSELAPSAMAELGLAYTMDRVGDRLYLADHRGGFHIIDISDMTHPRRLGGFDTPSKSWAIHVVDGVAFVADDSAGLLSFDVSDPTRPQLIGRYSPGGQAEDVVVRDGLAYVAFFDDGFHVVDIRDARHPKAVGQVAVPGNARGIQLVDHLAYVTGWESGLQVVDIRQPQAPRIIGHYDTRGSAWGVNVQGDFAYVLDWWGGIEVLNVADPRRPHFVSRYHARDPLGPVRTKGKYLYAANGPSGLQVFDIKNALNPIWAKGVDLPGTARDVWLDMDQAYVALGEAGVAVVDVLDPFYSRALGRVATPGAARRVRAWNGYLYVVDSKAGLMVMDVRKPKRPSEVARYPLMARDLWLAQGWLYGADAQGLRLYSLGSDGRLDAKTRYPLPRGGVLVRVQGEQIVVADGEGTLHLLRQDGERLTPVSTLALGERWRDAQLDQGRLYLLGERSGLMVVDITNDAQPRLTTVYPATGRHTTLALAQGAAFLGGEARLASVRLLPPVGLRPANEGQVTLHLPADWPIGDYHLLSLSADGRRHWYPAAIKSHRAGHPSGANDLEAIRRLLKGRLKPPPDP